MKKEAFHNLVRRILKEEITKRVPEMNGNGVDPEKKNKTFSSDPNSRDTKSKYEMLDSLKKAVDETVNEDYNVYWDDHDDLVIHGRDMIAVWITPLWEDNYRIIFMPRNEDRFYFNGLSWDQVIEFVKENLDQNKHHTGVEKARDKSWRNAKDQTDKASKGLSQENTLKVMTTDQPFTKEKNREKRYVEEQNKEEDNPNKPMREVGDFKRLTGYKVKEPVRLRKRIPDKKLVIKQS